MISQKNYLFIDGTNLYAAQYQLFGPNKYIDFSKFIQSIEKKLEIRFSKILFYASYTPRKNVMSKKLHAYIVNEFQFYQSVKKTPHTFFFKGYRSKTSGKEKEVDVKLSVDLVGYGLLDKYNSAYLLTGDADFLQAAHFLAKYKSSKKIQLICLANKIMFKGLFYYPSTVVQFDDKTIDVGKVARKAEFISLKTLSLLKSV